MYFEHIPSPKSRVYVPWSSLCRNIQMRTRDDPSLAKMGTKFCTRTNLWSWFLKSRAQNDLHDRLKTEHGVNFSYSKAHHEPM